MSDTIGKDIIEQAFKLLDSSEALRLTADLRDSKSLDGIAAIATLAGLIFGLENRKKSGQTLEVASDDDKMHEKVVKVGRPVVEQAFLLGWFARELKVLDEMT